MPGAADFTITDDEVDLLRAGLREWGGPASLTDSMAIAIGFASTADFFVQSQRMLESLAHGTPMPFADWRRALLATEVVFASDVVGSGIEWETTTGIRDVDALRLLRSVQRKIVH